MTIVEVPQWLVWASSLFLTFLIPWAVWITRQTYQNDKEIAINTANDEKVGDELQRLYDVIDEVKAGHKDRFDRLENKLDMFLNQEMLFLKQAVKP